MENDLKSLISDREKIMYEGKPNKKCFLFECIFNPLLPIALVWLFIDFGFIISTSSSGAFSEPGVGIFMIPFFLIHLMPVWIYLGGAIGSIIKYKNTYYIVTDQAVYISGGVVSKSFNVKPFQEMSRVNLHRGFFDQMFNVGDVVVTTNQLDSRGRVANMRINSISNYTEVYNLVKKLQTDIYTDAMYPNDMRPKENHGYNTQYKG